MHTDQLVKELEYLNYSTYDARRTAFMLTALSKDWRKATVARWLGISKVRVQQKLGALARRVERMAEVEEAQAIPGLVKVVRQIGRSKLEGGPDGTDVKFTQHEWRDESFAETILAYIAVWTSKSPAPAVGPEVAA